MKNTDDLQEVEKQHCFCKLHLQNQNYAGL